MVERYLSGFFLLISVLYLYAAHSLAFGSLVSPKSGFLPDVTGVAAVVLAAINFLLVLKKKITEESKTNILGKKVILFCLGLVGYLVALNFIGYTISTFIGMLFLLKVTDTKGWVVPLSVSAGISIGFYVVFIYILNVSLP